MPRRPNEHRGAGGPALYLDSTSEAVHVNATQAASASDRCTTTIAFSFPGQKLKGDFLAGGVAAELVDD